VSRLLATDQIDEHGAKAIDRVGGLTFTAAKVFDGERVEGAISHGVAINQQ